MYKSLLLAACLVLPLALHAADNKPTAQQEKMSACNKEAGEKSLKGDERKAFMSSCLSAKPAAPATQQEKMTSCNKEAAEKSLKGDDRKAFMSKCLSAGG